MGLAAFVAATALIYSFSASPKPKADAQWFVLKGGDQEVASNYEPVDYVPSCTTGSTRCAIHAQPDENGMPDLATIDQEKKKN